jgi:threonine dehydrogenase-like Zn-dependent dehydrogenase
MPKTHRALVLSSPGVPPEVKTIPTPQPTPGSAVVRILVANVAPITRDVYNGTSQKSYPTPLVTGSSAIGRVAAVGPDATLLTPGQLVLVDWVIRGRDDSTAVCVSGFYEGFNDGGRKLMHGEWRDSTYAEYAKVPLENCFVLNEARLLGPRGDDNGLGYDVGSLAYIFTLLIPYSGLRDINVSAGETVVVAPATGTYGGAAVLVALAMGARVIVMGRNLDALNRIAARSHERRIEVVQVTGDVQADADALRRFDPIDACFEISPAAAAKSTHLKSNILALRHGGRVSLMGGIHEDVPLPLSVIKLKNLQLKGRWMYTRDDVKELIKMVETGVLKLGESAGARVVGKFALEDWDDAFTVAADQAGPGLSTLITP